MPETLEPPLVPFAAGAAANSALAAPRHAQTPEIPRSGWVDAVIVGAGAAGIAAARRLAAFNKRFVLLEAAQRSAAAASPIPRPSACPTIAARIWLYAADINPLVKLGVQAGLNVYTVPPGSVSASAAATPAKARWRIFSRGWCAPTPPSPSAARKSDVACAQVLPKDLGDWRSTVEFVLGPYNCGKDLSELSTVDLARSVERDNSAFCRQGFGAVLAKLAAGFRCRRELR